MLTFPSVEMYSLGRKVTITARYGRRGPPAVHVLSSPRFSWVIALAVEGAVEALAVERKQQPRHGRA